MANRHSARVSISLSLLLLLFVQSISALPDFESAKVTTHRISVHDLPVDQVTVFLSGGAQVKRHLSLTVEEGENEIIIEQISPFADTSSFLVKGSGDAEISEVQTSNGPPLFNVDDPSNSSKMNATARAEWKSLQKQHQELQIDLNLIELRTKFLESLIERSTKEPIDSDISPSITAYYEQHQKQQAAQKGQRQHILSLSPNSHNRQHPANDDGSQQFQQFTDNQASSDQQQQQPSQDDPNSHYISHTTWPENVFVDSVETIRPDDGSCDANVYLEDCGSNDDESKQLFAEMTKSEAPVTLEKDQKEAPAAADQHSQAQASSKASQQTKRTVAKPPARIPLHQKQRIVHTSTSATSAVQNRLSYIKAVASFYAQEMKQLAKEKEAITQIQTENSQRMEVLQLNRKQESSEPADFEAATAAADAAPMSNMYMYRPRTVVATILVHANSKHRATLSISYSVTSAQWQPKYTLNVDTTASSNPLEPSARISYHGIVSQNSGEDWTKTELILSTARPTAREFIPTLNPVQVTQFNPRGGMGASSSSFAPASGRMHHKMAMNHMMMMDEGVAEEQVLFAGAAAQPHQPMRDMTEREASSVQFGFSIPNKSSSLMGDGRQHKVLVAHIPLNATLSSVCIPSKSAAVFRRLHATNLSKFPLTSGPVSIIVDHQFVSADRLPMTMPGDSFQVSLGVDDSIRVERSTKTLTHDRDSSSSSSFFDNFSFGSPKPKFTVQRVQHVSVLHNAHDYAVEVEVSEAIPQSGDAQISVSLLSPKFKHELTRLYEEKDSVRALFEQKRNKDGAASHSHDNDQNDTEVKEKSLQYEGNSLDIITSSVDRQGRLKMKLRIAGQSEVLVPFSVAVEYPESANIVIN